MSHRQLTCHKQSAECSQAQPRLQDAAKRKTKWGWNYDREDSETHRFMLMSVLFLFLPPAALAPSTPPRRLPSSLWLSVMIGPNGQRECLPAFLEDGVICRGDVVYLTPWADPLFPLWPDDAGTGLPQRALSVWTTTLEQTHRPRSLHTHTKKKCYCCPKKLRSGPYERCVD